MSTHRYWRLRVNSVVSANYVGIKWVELIGVLGGANLATHPTTGTATSSSTNNGSSTWAWTAGGGWTSAIADPFPQWTQFDFGSATTVVQAKITNTATVAACAQSCVVQSSDDGSSWTDESTFTNSALADGVTSVYFGPAEHGTVALTQPAGVLAALGASCAFVTSPLPALGVYSGAVMALSLPTPEIFFSTGARIELDVPAHTLLALGHNSYGDRAAFLTVPMCTLEITTGANAGVVAPAPTLATTGTVVGISSAALTPTIAALSASGTVSSMAQFDLTAPVQNLIGYGGAVCSITLTGKPTIAVAGTTGGIASVAVTCVAPPMATSARLAFSSMSFRIAARLVLLLAPLKMSSMPLRIATLVGSMRRLTIRSNAWRSPALRAMYSTGLCATYNSSPLYVVRQALTTGDCLVFSQSVSAPVCPAAYMAFAVPLAWIAVRSNAR